MNIRRDWICHLAAAVFSLVVVVPLVMVFGDRTLPFDIGHVFFTPTVARPGDTLTLNYTLTRVAKDCDGEVHQLMFDGSGHVWDLGVTRALYSERTDREQIRTFHRDKKVPMGFAPGPALYKARVFYWCNPLQRFYPLERVVEAPFTVY